MKADRTHDISDEAWKRIKPHTIGEAGTRGGNADDTRLFVNAVFRVLRFNIPWRELPPEYGNWNTVQRRFSRWRDKGVWVKVLEVVIEYGEFEWLMRMNRKEAGKKTYYLWPWLQLLIPSEHLQKKIPDRVLQVARKQKR